MKLSSSTKSIIHLGFSFGFCAVLLLDTVQAEIWPGWRGPRGDGTSQEQNVPTQWDATSGDGVAWKVAIPGRGHSSPIVWDDRIFVVSCLEEDNERVLVCMDRKDGRLLWQKTVLKSMLESKHQLNSFASGTPVTDGKSVYVTFLETDGTEVPAKNVSKPKNITAGVMVVAAYDMEGQQQWIARPSHFSSTHGYCSSPVIFKDLLIVNGDHDGDSSILALDRKTGDLVWKFPRVEQTRSYCTPIIRDVAGKTQMVLSGSKQVVSLDPNTGKQHWMVQGPTEQFVASMVFDGEKFYLSAGFPDHYVMAIRPDGQGDVTKSHVAWNITDAKCYVPSPVLVNDKLFVADDRGTVNCFATQNGKQIWKDRLGGHYSASLVTANGLVYCTADDGTVRVIKPDETLNIISTNPLGENSFASPAISKGQIFIRGENHLFAIGKTEAPSKGKLSEKPADLLGSKPQVLAAFNSRTEVIDDFEQRLDIFPTVFWEPLDTTSLRKLIRETPLVKDKRILEIGTGSGLVSLCCAFRGAASVVATDVNQNAVECARANSDRLRLAEKIEVRLVDTQNAKAFVVVRADEQFDLIISNPPWEEGKPKSIDQYALYDPKFELMKSLLVDARKHLTSDGEIYLAYGCRTAIVLLEKTAGELGFDFEVLDDRKLSDLTEVFLPGMLLKLKPKPTK